MLRLPVLVTTLLVSAGLLVTPAPAATSATAAPAGVSTVAWSTCSDAQLASLGLQCGSITVPLDRAHPTGAQVRLALTRRPHTGSTYRGVLLVNPGGPGGSGLSLPALADYVPGGVGHSYDWIGFDPRGVGASTPSLHCSSSYFGYDRPNYVPTRPALTRYWLRAAAGYAADCARTPAQRALLAHVTTTDTVLDMDSIRQALGAATMSYYGFSYGTYLGQEYATRFPTHVGRFVLDGVVNPGRVWYGANLDQDRAFDANINTYFHYLAGHPGAFRLGRHWRAIRRGYYRELRRLDRHPAVHGRLGPDELTDAMTDAGYYVYNWVDLGRAYSDLVRHGSGAAILADYAGANVGDDNGYAMYNAVQCSDATWPGFARTSADAHQIARHAPFLTWSNTWYNAPCLTWHAPHATPVAVSGRSLASKILLISETQDAATPFSGALAVRGLFPTASLVAGEGGTTHASSLSGVACVDDTVANYLASGVTPTRLSGTRADRGCPRLAPPQPSTAGGRVTTQSHDTMSPVLRRALLTAQRF